MLGLGKGVWKPEVISKRSFVNPKDYFGGDLVVWYQKGQVNMRKADDSTPEPGDEVRTWTDLSDPDGNNAVGTTSLPKLSNTGAGTPQEGNLWFNNQIDFMDFTELTFDGKFSIYARLQMTGTVNSDIFLSDKDTDNEFFRLKPDEIRAKLSGAAMDWTPDGAIVTDVYYTFGFERNASNLISVFKNKVAQVYDTSSSYGATAVNATEFSFDQIGGGNFTGYFSDIVIVDRDLTDSERADLYNYFEA